MTDKNRDKAEEVVEEPLQEDEAEKQLSLMGGVARAEAGAAETDEGGASKLLGQGTLLLVVVAVAAGGIYFMRLTQGDLGTKPIPKEVDEKIEWALATHNSEDPNNPLKPENMDALLNDTDLFISMFSADPANLQVPLEYVQKNPFMLPAASGDKKASNGSPVATRQDQEQVKRLQSELATYKVESILAGQTPMAMINGEILREGQTLGSFRIAVIHSRSVEVTAEDGQKYTLFMVQ